MKKFISVALAATMVLGAVGCSSKPAATTSSSGAKSSAPATSSQGATSEPKSEEDDPTQGDKFKITAGHANPEGTPMAEGWHKFEEVLEEMTGGRIDVELYANSALGSDRELIEAVQMGNITMCSPTSTPLASFVPEFFVYDMPFMFETREQGRAVFEDPEVMDVVNGRLESIGLKMISTWENGFRHITCNGKKTTPAEMKGFKIRTMENELHLAVWRALGANPTPLAYGELYTALQQKTVEGQENPYAQAWNTKFYEVQDHLIETGHMYLPFIILCNNDWYNKLSEKDQKIVTEAMQQATDYEFEFATTMEADFREKLSAEMTILALTDEERDTFVNMINDAGIKDLCIEKSQNPEFATLFFDKVDAATK